MATSILSRKRDFVYLLYFSFAIPIAFIVDIQPLYASSMVPEWMSGITGWYVRTYNDQHYVETKPYFELFLWSEVLYQVPVMIWGVGALLNDSPKLPLVLLPFSCLIFVSTGVCMFEFWHWAIPMSEKLGLSTLYGPYLVLSGIMLVDMYLRLDKQLSSTQQSEGQKKRK